MGLPITYRFEYYENVISKHHLNRIDWRQAAIWAFKNRLNRAEVTVASTRMIDDDTVEIIKRVDQNKTFRYQWGFDQLGLYERVIINRKENTVSVDRLDANWWIAQPFLGQRDHFYIEKDDRAAILSGTSSTKQQRLAFVRHNFWLHKLMKFNTVVSSNFSARSYRKAFASEQV